MFLRVLCVMLLLSTAARAQPFGHEWIVPEQTYYKIKTARNDWYGLTRADLPGLPANVPVERLQLFHHGRECAVRIAGNGPFFGEGDTLYFYGRINEGQLDSALYVTPAAQLNPHRALISDTTAFFLTWGDQLGKRIPTLTQTTAEANVSFHLATVSRFYNRNNGYSVGESTPAGIKSSAYVDGEGWFHRDLGNTTNNRDESYTFDNLTGLFRGAGAPPIRAEVRLIGRNNLLHRVQISVGPTAGNLQPVETVDFGPGFGSHTVNLIIPPSAVNSSGTVVVNVRPLGINGSVDRVAVAYLRITFPREMTWFDPANALRIELPARPDNTFRLAVQNAPAGFEAYDITDPYNIVRRGGQRGSDQTLRLALFNAEGARVLRFSPNGTAQPVGEVERVRFPTYNPARAEYVIISHPRLMAPAEGESDAVRAYAAYRASAAGGGHDTLVANMRMLYDQFAYGETTELAVRNFMAYLLANGNPQHLFLIGKGLQINQGQFFDRTLVPTFGIPASDIQFTAGLNGTRFEPAVPTGRLSVEQPAGVLSYLDKVRTQEATPYTDNLWRKEVVHLSGGRTTQEIATFQNNVNTYEGVARQPLWGGNVFTRTKQTFTESDTFNISAQVNRGVSLVTLFGHSSTTVTDVNIGNVTDPFMGYQEVGKYPLILVNGCDAGNIFGTGFTLSENWVNTPRRGAIGFIAHTDLGLSSVLHRYSTRLYQFMSTDSLMFGTTIGQMQQAVIRELQPQFNRLEDESLYQQFALHGDPAVRVFAPEKPDYAPRRAALRPYDGLPVTAATDSFRIEVVAANFGRAVNDSLWVAVEQRLPSGALRLIGPFQVAPLLREDTLRFNVLSAGPASAGNNRFRVILDFGDSIPELDETNNTVDIEAFLPASGVRALLPTEFSMVGQNTLTLVAESNNFFERNRTYLFELDTTIFFNSIIKRATSITADRIAVWDLAPPLDRDSTVYYWRVRFADDENWNQSSFVHIPQTPEGWSQSHRYQFRKSILEGIRFAEPTQRWAFVNDTFRIEAASAGQNFEGNATLPGGRSFRARFALVLNGQPLANTSPANDCPSNRSYVACTAFDQFTLEPYLALRLDPDPDFTYACGVTPYLINRIFNGDVQNANVARLNQFIDAVPTGDYVVIVAHNASNQQVTYQTWNNNVDVFGKMVSDLGANANNLNALRNGDPYILFSRKGAAPNTASERIPRADSLNIDGQPVATQAQQVRLDTTFVSSRIAGSVTSPLIGPATQWTALHHHIPTANSEDYRFDLFGVDSEGTATLLYSGKPTSPFPLTPDVINAVQHPFLRLRVTLKDSVAQVPPPLRRWQVTYEGVPEGIFVSADANDYQVPDKQEGQTFDLAFGFRNISGRDFAQPIAVRYELNHPQGQVVDTVTLRALAAGDTLRFVLPLETIGRQGENTLLVNFNPRLQPEAYYENNAYQLSYRVLGDETNPVLDVTFDGTRIMDGDIVSPSPLITVRLKDENPFFRIESPDNVRLFLRRPGESGDFQQIASNDPAVSWTTMADQNDFRLTYQPEELGDGLYTLRVQGEDASGNVAGALDYQVNFEVINEASITHFYPYPNPFTTSTRFVFTLTGRAVPEHLKVQIFTVTGKVVREIQREELGPIRIGHNVTEFAWDGTDQFGDRLANGVYLYRVLVRDSQEAFEHRETAGDKYFKKNFGKMYILR